MYCPLIPKYMQQQMAMLDEDDTMGLPVRYPNIYHKVYPRIKSMCEAMDTPGNPSMMPYPSEEIINQMTERIYNDVLKEDLSDLDSELQTGERQFSIGGRRVLRDLISILLIRQLLRRRRRFFFGSPGFGFPGFGY